MKRVSLLVILLVMACALVPPEINSAELTYTSNRHTPIQAAVRKKAYQQVPFSLTAASKVIRFQGTVQAGELDLVGALGAIVRTTSGNLTCWYDSDTTKTWTLDGGVEHELISDTAASTVTCKGTDTSIQVGGF